MGLGGADVVLWHLLLVVAVRWHVYDLQQRHFAVAQALLGLDPWMPMASCHARCFQYSLLTPPAAV